ncbi:MAG: transcriptional regulator [Chitinophagia bacterium]|nr:transcriptional regulator [Chitinophagia bacterium]
MNVEFRCKCPISSALDIIGDKWSLLIIRDMLFARKKTFTEFSTSAESIASNILSSRLKLLEEARIIRKGKMEGNLKTNIYTLTEKGLNLIPVIAEITIWSDENMREFNPIMADVDRENLRHNKQAVIEGIRQGYLKSIAGLI